MPNARSMERNEQHEWPAVSVIKQAGLIFAYRVAKPSQYLIRTGFGAKNAKVCKKTFQGPLHTVTVIEMNPVNYTFNLSNMSSEMVPFKLPVVFTIGPQEPFPPTKDIEALVPHNAADIDQEAHRERIKQEAYQSFMVYANTMSGLSRRQVHNIIEGVIEGETRVFSAGLTIKEMFEDREKFRKTVQDKVGSVEVTKQVQKDMDRLGLRIFNANIAEMHDLDAANKYFETLKQKALETAKTEMRIEVAEARKRGDIGERTNQGQTTVKLTTIEAEVQRENNLRQQDIQNSKADLAVVMAKTGQREKLAKIEADNVAARKQVELETELNKLKMTQHTEHLRATTLAQKNVEAEANVRQAKGAADAQRAAADGELYAALKVADPTRARFAGESKREAATGSAEAARIIAQGDADAMRIQAEAELFAHVKKSEGLKAMASAQAAGLAAIANAAGGNVELAKFHMALERDLFVDLAKQTACALQGLSPKLNIWNTGAAGDGVNPMAPMQKLFQSLPPMLDALQQQTNVRMPSWAPEMQAGAPINDDTHNYPGASTCG